MTTRPCKRCETPWPIERLTKGDVCEICDRVVSNMETARTHKRIKENYTPLARIKRAVHLGGSD